MRWYVFAASGFDDSHTPHWHGNTVLVHGTRKDVVDLGGPLTMVTADMVPDDIGTWLYHCHMDLHAALGMSARYRVLPADGVVPADTAKARTDDPMAGVVRDLAVQGDSAASATRPSSRPGDRRVRPRPAPRALTLPGNRVHCAHFRPHRGRSPPLLPKASAMLGLSLPRAGASCPSRVRPSSARRSSPRPSRSSPWPRPPFSVRAPPFPEKPPRTASPARTTSPPTRWTGTTRRPTATSPWGGRCRRRTSASPTLRP